MIFMGNILHKHSLCKWKLKWQKSKSAYTLLFNKNVVFPAQAEYSYFSADFRLEHSCIILTLQLMTCPFQNLLGYHQFYMAKKTKENCIVFTDVSTHKIISILFKNLSLGFFLEIVLKFSKFQPRYSYKIYYKKKSVCAKRPIRPALLRII